MRSSRVLAALGGAAALALASLAAGSESMPAPPSLDAEVLAIGPIPDERPPRPRPTGRGWRESRTRQEWEQTRVFVNGGIGWPWSFPEGWQPGPGWGAGFDRALAPWCDYVVEVEYYRHRFDEDRLRERGATPLPGSRRAEFSELAFDLRMHAPRLGRRAYGVFGLALSSVSRPAITYDDAGGRHELPGNDVLGMNVVMGAGLEQATTGRLGGGMEGRWVITPGEDRPTEHLFVLRAGLSLVVVP